MTSSPSLSSRVEREREAHTAETDVLGESYRLKERFHLVFEAPHAVRLRADWARLTAEVGGKTVLDYGCGRGELSLDMAARGAVVKGIDLSETYVAEAAAAALAKGYGPDRVSFVAGDVHALPYPPETFDMVIGEGILHHLDLDAATADIRRVLKPGGVAIFKEPLVGAPWMRLFRRLTPKARTTDERPLDAGDLGILSSRFEARFSYYGVLVPAAAAALSLTAPRGRFTRTLGLFDRLDQTLARTRKADTWHQYVVLALSKPQAV